MKSAVKPRGLKRSDVKIVEFVPNGTTLISANVAKYVTRYRSFAKRTAESIIQLSSTLVDAQDRLSDEEFEVFCTEVGIDRNGSTFRKLQKIGENAVRFAPFLDQMPNAWTSIYRLAKLENEEFDHIASNGTLTPFMTANEISRQFRERARQPPRQTVTLVVDDLTKAQKLKLQAELDGLSERYGFQIVGRRMVSSTID